MSSPESPTVREVLGTTLTLIRANASLLFGTALVCALPGFLGAVFVEPILAPSPFAFAPAPDGLVGTVALYRLYSGISFAVTSVLVTVALAIGASVAVTAHRGQTISTQTIMRRVRMRIVPLAGLGVLMGIVALLGTMCFVLPGVYLQVLFALAPAVCVTEFAGPATSLERSASLTEGRRMHVFRILLVLMIPRLVYAALLVAFAYYISRGMERASFITGLSVVFRDGHGWGGALLRFIADVLQVLFGGVGFGVVYARAAGIPVASTIDARVETFA